MSGTRTSTGAREFSGAMGILVLAVLGAQTMVLELTFPRLIAPAFGNTLFAWTAIIAVVLTALSAGYALGGRLARRRQITRTVYGLAAGSALWVLGLSLFGGGAMRALGGLDLILGPLGASILLAAVPALLSAAVVPLVVALRPEEPAHASGTCFAWSTVGSILGVLATGYLLLPGLGIAGSLQLGSGLVLLALLLASRSLLALPGPVLLAAVVAFGPAAEEPGVLYSHSNGYHHIRVVEDPTQGARLLYLDSAVEGAMLPSSLNPGLPYQRAVGRLAHAVPGLERTFFIGGGSFSMPKYIQAGFPDAQVDVAELDPDVTRVARDYLELPETLNVLSRDGRRMLAERNGPRYDLIVNDAFHGVRNVPFHLLTREFGRVVEGRLTHDGLYAVNIASNGPDSTLLHSVTLTLQEVFAHVRWFEAFRSSRGLINTWVLASHAPYTLGQPAPAPTAAARILTDNDAPIEYLVARELLRAPR